MKTINRVLDLARYFVTEFVGRRWLPADYRGRHMKAASRLLKEMKYDYDAVIGALMALKEHDFAQFGYISEKELPQPPFNGMEVLWFWGEPPLIERFIAPDPMPPVWSVDYDKWVERWGKIAIMRGEWDGHYTNDPTNKDWLRGIIGERRYQESIQEWQTLQRTSPPKKPSSGTSPETPPP